MEENFDFKIKATFEEVENLLEKLKELDRVLTALDGKNVDFANSQSVDDNLKGADSKIRNYSQKISDLMRSGVSKGIVAGVEDAVLHNRSTVKHFESLATSELPSRKGGARQSDYAEQYARISASLGNYADKTRYAKGEEEKFINTNKTLRSSLKSLESLQDKVAIALGKKIAAGKDDEAETKRLSSAYSRLSSSLDYFRGKLNSQNRELKKANAELDAHKRAARAASLSQKDFNARLDDAVGKLLRYRAAYAVMQQTVRGFRESIQTFVDVNYELAQVTKVIKPTQAELESIKNLGFELGETYGGSISEIVKSYKIWAQTGLRNTDVINALNASLLAANATGLTASDVTEDLTAVIFSYGKATEDLIPVIDKWIAVQRAYPVTAADLANSVKAVGAAANSLGVDIDNLIGMVTSIASATRKTGREVGTSLKTIFARIVRDQTVNVFADVGVSILKTQDSMRNLSDVLDDLAKRWPTLTDVQKKNIAQQAAGIRRYVDFIALMDNYDVKIGATNVAVNAFNVALEANRAEMDTFKKSVDVTIRSLEKFGESYAGGLSNTMAASLKAVRGISESLSSSGIGKALALLTVAVSTFGAIKVSAIVAGFAISKFRKHLAQLTTTTAANNVQVKLLGKNLVFATSASMKFGKALRLLGTSGIIGILAAAAITIADLVGLFDSATEEADDFRSKLFEISETVNEVSDNFNKKSAFEGLVKARDEAIALREEMKEMGKVGTKDWIENQKKITEQTKELAGYSNTLELAIVSLGDAADTATSQQERLNAAIRETQSELENTSRLSLRELQSQAIESFGSNYKDRVGQFKKEKEALIEIEGAIVDLKNRYKEIGDLIPSIYNDQIKTLYIGEDRKLFDPVISEDIVNFLEIYKSSLQEIGDISNINEDAIAKDIEVIYTAYKTGIFNAKSFSNALTNLYEVFSKAKSTTKQNEEGLNTLIEAMEKLSYEVNTNPFSKFLNDLKKAATEDVFIPIDVEGISRSLTEMENKVTAFVNKSTFGFQNFKQVSNIFNDLSDSATGSLDKIISYRTSLLQSGNTLLIELKNNISEVQSQIKALNSLDTITQKQKNQVTRLEDRLRAYLKQTARVANVTFDENKSVTEMLNIVQNAMDNQYLALQREQAIRKSINKQVAYKERVYSNQVKIIEAESKAFEGVSGDQTESIQYQINSLRELKKSYSAINGELAFMGYEWKTNEKIIEDIDIAIENLAVKLKLLEISKPIEQTRQFKQGIQSGLSDIMTTLPHAFADNIGEGIVSALESVSDNIFSQIADRISERIVDGASLGGELMKKELIQAGGIIAGQILGAVAGGGTQSAGIGANIGSTFGSAAFSQAGFGLGMYAGPIGSIVGGLAGGVLGGLFGGDDEEEEEVKRAINKNTDAVNANTQVLEEFSKVVINAPATYTVPRISGGTGGITINVSNTSVENANNALSKYGLEIRRSGGRARGRVN